MNESPEQSVSPKWRFALFAVLFLVAIPWYWQPFGWSSATLIEGAGDWLVVPVWFAVPVIGSFVISATAAWLLRRPWPEELAERGRAERKQAGSEQDELAPDGAGDA